MYRNKLQTKWKNTIASCCSCQLSMKTITKIDVGKTELGEEEKTDPLLHHQYICRQLKLIHEKKHLNPSSTSLVAFMCMDRKPSSKETYTCSKISQSMPKIISQISTLFVDTSCTCFVDFLFSFSLPTTHQHNGLSVSRKHLPTNRYVIQLR